MSMGITQMNSLLSSQNTLKNMETLNAVKTAVGGDARIMAAEIKQDKGRGMDTAKKEDELSNMEERADSISESMANSIAELNESIAKDQEKIREEEADKAKKVEENDAKVSTGHVTGLAEPIDTVGISPEAKAAAEADPANVASIPTTVAQTGAVSTGVAVDIKV